MLSVENMIVEECKNSAYVSPFRLNFTHNGKPRKWDLIKSHDSVAILLYHVERKSLLFVQQFRPAVYYNKVHPSPDPPPIGMTLSGHASLGLTVELCAGIVDKNKSLRQIALEEIHEEVGFKVPDSNLERIVGVRTSVGVTGSHQDIFYAEVTESMRDLDSGGGNREEGEFIDTIEIPVAQVRDFIFDEGHVKPSGCAFSVMWFLNTKYKPGFIERWRTNWKDILIASSFLSFSSMLVAFGVAKALR